MATLFPEEIDAATERMYGKINIANPDIPREATPKEKDQLATLLRQRKTLADAAGPFISQAREALQRDLDRLKKKGTTPTNEETQTMWQELRRLVGRGPVRDLDAKNDEIVEFVTEVRRRIYRSKIPAPLTKAEKLEKVRREQSRVAGITGPEAIRALERLKEEEKELLASGAGEEDELNRRIASRGEELRGLMGGRKKRKTRKTRKSRKVTRRRR